MKRPRRIVRTVILALSTLSLAALAWLWVRSYATLDEISHVTSTGSVESILSFRGGLHLSRAGERAAERRWMWDAYAIPPNADWDALYTSGALKFRRVGFGWLRGRPFNSTRPFGNTLTRPLVPWLNMTPYNAVVVPYWFVAIVLATPWWWRFVAPVFGRFRKRPGTCRRCGYDLRATPDRCPECGLVPKRKPVRVEVREDASDVPTAAA